MTSECEIRCKRHARTLTEGCRDCLGENDWEMVVAGSARTFTLGEFGIVVVVDGDAGSITSELHDGDSGMEGGDEALDAGFDAIERMILAHACAGVDVCDARYVAGVVTAVEAVTNEYA